MRLGVPLSGWLSLLDRRAYAMNNPPQVAQFATVMLSSPLLS